MTPTPQSQGLNNIAGNWQFSPSSTAGGSTSLTMAGSITQTGKVIGGAMHFDGSSCFDSVTTIALTGTLTGGKLSLSSTPVNGQVTTLTGSVTDSTFSGSYAVTGGCADGETGTLTGMKMWNITGSLNSTFTNTGNQTFSGVAQITEGTAGPEGNFGISGTATFTNRCFASGTITSGVFPSGSYLLGTSLVLAIHTNNGTVTFHGTVDESFGQIMGDYAISGGTCDETGPAVLGDSSPWDY